MTASGVRHIWTPSPWRTPPCILGRSRWNQACQFIRIWPTYIPNMNRNALHPVQQPLRGFVSMFIHHPELAAPSALPSGLLPPTFQLQMSQCPPPPPTTTRRSHAATMTHYTAEMHRRDLPAPTRGIVNGRRRACLTYDQLSARTSRPQMARTIPLTEFPHLLTAKSRIHLAGPLRVCTAIESLVMKPSAPLLHLLTDPRHPWTSNATRTSVGSPLYPLRRYTRRYLRRCLPLWMRSEVSCLPFRRYTKPSNITPCTLSTNGFPPS